MHNFDLKVGLIKLLPKYYGLADENPYKHIKEFTFVCSSMKPTKVLEEAKMIRPFPLSLHGVVR